MLIVFCILRSAFCIRFVTPLTGSFAIRHYFNVSLTTLTG